MPNPPCNKKIRQDSLEAPQMIRTEKLAALHFSLRSMSAMCLDALSEAKCGQGRVCKEKNKSHS